MEEFNTERTEDARMKDRGSRIEDRENVVSRPESPSGVDLIAQERRRQIEVEGWDEKHDRWSHTDGELAVAACCYATPKPLFVHEVRAVQINDSRGLEANGYRYDVENVMDYYDPWPWDDEWDKRDKHDRIRKLVIAGALLAAEIDRLQGCSTAEDGEDAENG
jgi:hypothetical protein